MPKPNTQFELSVEDMDLIEQALHNRKEILSEQVTRMKTVDEDLKESLSSVHELLGRLHNQKEFYRPRAGTYLGG